MTDTVFSISEITRAIGRSLEQGYGSIAVQGEISNFVQHSSGHRYFTLKDSSAQLKAVMWRSSTLRFTPTNGMNVVARGKITMYAPQGAVQLECKSLEPLGVGDLQLAFEALKRTLFERGWFDAARKKPLPRFPMKIGVATSPTGAAVRDILSTLARRMPACEVLLRPTLVQGNEAAEDIARAIAELNTTDCEVVIVGRGGGSMEDLWAFNTEAVAAAIVASRIPVISAVGHEIDFTIADFVADVRAATPTAAAELAVRDAAELLAGLMGTQELLDRLMDTRLAEVRRSIDTFRTNAAFRRMMERIRLHEQTLDTATHRMNSALWQKLSRAGERVSSLTGHLSSLHPLAPLKRGFALVRRGQHTISPDETLQAGEIVELMRERETASVLVMEAKAR
jgi:exodeoxyribonuclease VII large subunit